MQRKWFRKNVEVWKTSGSGVPQESGSGFRKESGSGGPKESGKVEVDWQHVEVISKESGSRDPKKVAVESRRQRDGGGKRIRIGSAGVS